MNTPSAPRSILRLTLLLLLAGAATAQTRSSWTPLSPPGGVDSSKLQFGKSVAVYRDGLYMRAYSAITRGWYPHTLSFGTTLQLRDNLVAIPESDRWTVFSAYRGAFETLLTDFATTTWQASDSLFAVRDGNTAHVFSAYTGHWHTHSVPATWTMRLEERVAVFADATTTAPTAGAAVFDGFSGQWHDVAGRNETLRVRTGGGTALLLFDSGGIGFSTQRGALETLPPPVNLAGGTFSTNSRSDLVQTRGFVYSGVTGGFAQPPFPTQPFGNSPSYWLSGLVVRGGAAFHHPYVMATGNAWVPVPANSLPAGMGITWAAYTNGSDAYAFSAVTNQLVAQTFVGTPTGSEYRDHVLAMIDTATDLAWFFSGLTGQWYPSPVDALPNTWPFYNFTVGDDGAVLKTTNGVVGFSAHTGEFVPLPGTGLSPLWGHSTALGAWDATHLHVFDAAKAVWQSTPIAITIPQMPITSTVGWPSATLVVDDASKAVGYTGRIGKLETLPLTEAVLDRGVLGDLGWVRTASTVHMFSGYGEHVSWMSLPYDLVGCGRGAVMRHQVSLDNGSFALLGLGPRRDAAVPLPPFGDVWLDPAQTALVLLTQTGSEQRVEVSFPIPTTPGLSGTEWFLQPLILPSSGAAFVAEPSSFRVF